MFKSPILKKNPYVPCFPSLREGREGREEREGREQQRFQGSQREVETSSNNPKRMEYLLENFQRSNQDTCLTQKPAVFEGSWVQSGDLLTDCSSSVGGELSLGQNLLIAYMPWEGYNFEDAILISERLVIDDLYTSVHIERYELEIHQTKLGTEEITQNIPDISEKEIQNLDSFGIVKVGTWVEEGDILVGKITPINKKKISPYQKLLYTILEKQVNPFKDSSLRAPRGIKAKVIDIKYFFKRNPYSTFLSTAPLISTSVKESSTEKSVSLFSGTKRSPSSQKTICSIKSLISPVMSVSKGNLREETETETQTKTKEKEIKSAFVGSTLSKGLHQTTHFPKRVSIPSDLVGFYSQLESLTSGFAELDLSPKSQVSMLSGVNTMGRTLLSPYFCEPRNRCSPLPFLPTGREGREGTEKKKGKNLLLGRSQTHPYFWTEGKQNAFRTPVASLGLGKGIKSSFHKEHKLQTEAKNVTLGVRPPSVGIGLLLWRTKGKGIPTERSTLIRSGSEKDLQANQNLSENQKATRTNSSGIRLIWTRRTLKNFTETPLGFPSVAKQPKEKQRVLSVDPGSQIQSLLPSQQVSSFSLPFLSQTETGGLPLRVSSESNPFAEGKDGNFCFEKSHSSLRKQVVKSKSPMVRIERLRHSKAIAPHAELRSLRSRDKFIKEKLETIHIYLAEKRKIQVGDKMAGRHGNKGIVSQILPIQDMPYLPDGTPIDMVLNPLGVPSRMNVGQLYECLLGFAGKYLGEHFKVFAFDEMYGPEASRSLVFSKLYEARQKTGFKWLFDPNSPGKIRLYDGRTGECFHQKVTVGQAYMLRLVHMVDDKMHMRSTGPYSLVTQQPLRGRSKQGGQRLGEMEVWALEGYGAAFTLLEMLTIKSDDMTGRMTLWSNLILNKEISIGTPESFKVLVCELQALCLDIGLYRLKNTPTLSTLEQKDHSLSYDERGTFGRSESSQNTNKSSLKEIDKLINLP